MDEETPQQVPHEKPSQIPSWVTLGFALGALSVLALPRRAPQPPAQAEEAPVAAKPSAPPRLTTIEAVFVAWEKYAVWADGTTEVALWDPETKSFSDFYEVLRVRDALFFRSIPALTRPILTHGVVSESPLLFTETARQRAEWVGEANRENWKAIEEGVRQSLGTKPPQSVPEPTEPHP